VLILISSSGNSKNIINAAKVAKKLGLKLITLSGFSKRNQLQNKGAVNFYVDSNNYNIIESTHLIILLQIVENIINKSI
jgi:phosphoheptose isomerase